MANIKKGFNFRNGVQVDDDNLKVSPTGLVGIGTTVPTEALDVRGNLVVTGVSSVAIAQAGVLTVTTLNPSEIIGAGVSIKSGIVTASSGIITFFGDARFLQGMPTSQWEDVNTGFGVTSIYNTGGNVGIATSNPQFTLQIGANVNSFKDGVGISSFGDIKVSGIITATDFNGNITGTGATFTSISGDVTGNVTGLINSSGISTFGGINATGRIVGSATSNVIPFLYSNLSDLPSASTYHGAFAHVHSQGKGYFAHAGNWWELVNKEQDGTVGTGVENYVIDRLVSTSTTATSLNVAGVSTFGVSTFSEDVITGVGATVGLGTDVFFGDNIKATFGSANEVQMFHKPDSDDFRAEFDNTNFVILSRTLDFKNQAGDKATITAFEPGGIPEVRLFNDGNEKLRTTGIGVTIFNQLDTTNIVASGIITASTELNSPLIGVGTDIPANDIQVRKSGNAEIQVTSDTGIAGLTVGRESGTGNTNNAEFRYGGGSGSPYSSDQSLDIINYGLKNFNYFLSGNNPGGAQGDFIWHKGLNSDRLMTLSKDGNLGIGITIPTSKLHVVGGCSFTGNSTFSNNLTVGNNLTVNNNLSVPSGITANVTGNVTGTLFGNINATSGLSTSQIMSIEGSAIIGTSEKSTSNNVIVGTSNNRLFIDADGRVGIKTTLIGDPNVVVEILGNVRFKKAVSVGNTTRSAVDFSDVVNITNEGDPNGLPFNRSQLAYMIPPRVTTTQRNQLRDAYTNSATLISGAMVYNTTINKLQVWNGSSWETVTSS